MSYSRTEIDELALGQLSAEEVARAVAAFNGFEQLFGAEWIANFFKGSRAPSFVSYVRSLWEDWVVVLPMPQSDNLSRRWAAGIGKAGVEAEVKVFAYLQREGVEVELFPNIESGRVPDCRFRLNETSIYVEASQRGVSEIRRRGEDALTRLAESAARAFPGYHGKLAVLHIPTTEEVERIMSWLGTLISPGESQLEDLAIFYKDWFESPTSDEDRIAQIVPKPRLFTTCVIGAEFRGTACLGIADNSAQAVLEAEAAQLPISAPGMIFLDLSSVIGSYEEWGPLIQRRLQPRINTRIGGVILYQTRGGVHGPTMAGIFLSNPYALHPLPEEVVQLGHRFCRRAD
jgi:hypothetical protein